MQFPDVEPLWNRYYELADRRHREGLTYEQFVDSLENLARTLFEEQMNKKWEEAQTDTQGHYRALARRSVETLLQGWTGGDEEDDG